MKQFAVLAALLAALSPTAGSTAEGQQQSAAATAPGDPLTEGEVRKVNRDAKKLTIRHGPIRNLDMPPMTMVFQVKDPEMLERVKAGDKIRFVADRVGSAYTVIRLEVVP